MSLKVLCEENCSSVIITIIHRGWRENPLIMGFSLNGAELSLISGISENLRNHWGMNWVQYKDLLCYMCPCGTVVSSLSLTQEILVFNPAILQPLIMTVMHDCIPAVSQFSNNKCVWIYSGAFTCCAIFSFSWKFWWWTSLTLRPILNFFLKEQAHWVAMYRMFPISMTKYFNSLIENWPHCEPRIKSTKQFWIFLKHHDILNSTFREWDWFKFHVSIFILSELNLLKLVNQISCLLFSSCQMSSKGPSDGLSSSKCHFKMRLSWQ